MKFKNLLTLILTCTVILTPITISASPHHAYLTRQFSNGKTARYTQINLKAEGISAGVGLANNQAYSAETLENIIKHRTPSGKKPIAAINATYFSAYNGIPVPYGTIIDNGEILHIGNTGAVLGITKDKQVVVDNLKIEITGSINGIENQFYTWGINHPRSESDAIMIFTPRFAPITFMPDAQNVIIEDGVVVRKTKGNTPIPKNGYVIAFNPALHNLTNRFNIGDRVNYTPYFSSSRKGATQVDSDIWKDVVYAVGAGPSIIINNGVTADGTKEGFTEAKINTQRAQRSFIGARENGVIIMGTVSNANLTELAQICQELRLVNAINLDGGASSGLWYGGTMRTTPGRALNNALLFFE